MTNKRLLHVQSIVYTTFLLTSLRKIISATQSNTPLWLNIDLKPINTWKLISFASMEQSLPYLSFVYDTVTPSCFDLKI